MKTILPAAALVLAVALSAPARDFRPDMSFENIPAGDESVQQCLVFPTTPGVGYRVEWSHDLTDWTTDEEVYGLGFDFVVAMREFTPPPPPPEPGPGDPPPPVPTPSLRASLVFREASGETPGTIVSWKSLDHGGPMKRFLPLVMTENWSQLPFYWRTFDDCDFFITALGNPVEPPDPDAPLGTKDAEMISCLEDHFAEIDAEIDASAARARNTPPPAPPDPQAKKFWRVHCDAGIDTDGDGSPDWAEFEISGSAVGVLVAGVSADAFDADTNGDGIPDGEQLDVDGDGTADANDIGLDDAAASYDIVRPPRYALFPITNAEPESPGPPLQINDRGTVLYPDGTWAGGVWTALQQPSGDETAAAIGINDNDVVLGSSLLNVTVGSHELEEVGFCYWPDPYSALVWPVTGTGDQALHPVALPGSSVTHIPASPGPVLSNEGVFRAIKWGVASHDATSYQKIFEPVHWTLPAGPSGQSSHSLTDHRLHYCGENGFFWGSGHPLHDPDQGGIAYEEDTSQPLERLIHAPAPLPDPGFVPQNLLPASNGVYALRKPFTGKTRFYNTNLEKWVHAGMFSEAIDISSDGTAIGNSHDGKIAPVLLNGRWLEIGRCAPDLAAEWEGPQVNHRDTTPGGWILSCDGDPLLAETHHAVMLPLWLEPGGAEGIGLEIWDGVDAISVGAILPTAPVRDALWMMAPLGGGETHCLLKAPLNARTPLKLSGTKLRFDGNAEITLTGSENTFTVAPATGQTIESGTEADVTLHLGGVEAASKPLKVKFMKHRTVKVNLYHVPLAADAPDFSFSHTQVDALLTNTFLPKLNLDFDVRPVVTLDGGWDADGDGAMDAKPLDNLHAEQQSTLDSRPSDALESNIDIFLMSGNRFVVNGSKHGDVPAEGVTNRAQRCCWINAETLANPQVPGSGRPESDAMVTLIHEVGHIFTNYGHPDQEEGVSPLRGTDRTLRLMHSGDSARGGRVGTVLVKEEWDAAEAWLKGEVDTNP